MAATLISERERVEEVSYTLDFSYLDGTGGGFSFLCNENGEVDQTQLNPAARANFNACLAGQVGAHRVGEARVRTWRSVRYNPTVIRCECGRRVELWDSWENGCDCGRAYNGFGQGVKPNYGYREATLDGEQWDDDC